jgi:hypothetical protein
MMETAKQGASCKITRVKAEKRMQVREDLRLDQFMPPLHPILVACEKRGKCATLREFVFVKAQNDGLAVWQLQLPELRPSVDCSGRLSFLHQGPLVAHNSLPQECIVDSESPHLEFMEQFIAADLREERMPERSSRRLSSALPRWLIAGKNRDDVVRCLKKLREKLEEARLS